MLLGLTSFSHVLFYYITIIMENLQKHLTVPDISQKMCFIYSNVAKLSMTVCWKHFADFTIRIPMATVTSMLASVCPVTTKVKMADVSFLRVTYLKHSLMSSLFRCLFHFLCRLHLRTDHRQVDKLWSKACCFW